MGVLVPPSPGRSGAEVGSKENLQLWRLSSWKSFEGNPLMIITRTPLRISIGGGGTDLPSYYEQHGGFVLSAAISQYIFVSVNRMFGPGYTLKYSSMENVQTVDE